MKNPISSSQGDRVDVALNRDLKSHSKSTTEPQYEECAVGVTSNDVVLKENPSYQLVDVAASKAAVESTYY